MSVPTLEDIVDMVRPVRPMAPNKIALAEQALDVIIARIGLAEISSDPESVKTHLRHAKRAADHALRNIR